MMGVKRTWRGLLSMSASDPKRTCANDLDARGAGPAATVCTPVIAARWPIPLIRRVLLDIQVVK